jgi:branched-chain amino acid transport system substrate-binding protein
MKSTRYFWVASLFVLCTTVAHADVVKVGVSAPMSGVQQGVGLEVKAFWDAFAKYATNKKLLKNHRLDVIAADDGFDAKRSAENAQKLIDQGAVVLTGTAGVPHVLGMIPALEKANVPMLAPNGGAVEIRGKSPAVFHIKSSFAAEVDRAADILGSMGADKFVLITDDAPGRATLAEQFAKRVAAKGGQTSLLKTIIVAQKGGDVATAVRDAMALKPSGIFLMTIAGMVPQALQTMKEASYSGLIATWSIAATDQVIKAAGESGRSVIFTTIVPAPTNAKVDLSKKFLAFCEITGVKPSFRGMEAYVSGLVLVNALNRVPGNVTGQALSNALEATRKLDLGGLSISYGPGERDGSNFVDIVVLGRDGRFRY